VRFVLALAGALGCRSDAPHLAAPAAPQATVVDDFEDVSAWSAHPADGVALAVRAGAGARGGALRLDFDFHGGGGYAVVRRAVALDLAENYAFSFRIRGEAPPNHLEFKLVDTSGDNVWWHVERDVQFARAWRTITIPKRKIQFAWGPAGGGEIRHAAALEFAITAGSGGRGSVWIDALELRALPSTEAPPPPLRAQASSAAADAMRAVDADTATAWSPAPADRRPWIAVDLGAAREFSGVVLHWQPGRHPPDYDLEASDDGQSWRRLRRVRGSNGGRDALFLPETAAHVVRLRLLSACRGGPALAEIQLQPLAWAASPTAFFQAEARAAPRGMYPRSLSGEQVYWTVVGGTSDADEFLLSEDGTLEIGVGGFTLEPFLFESRRLYTWADVGAAPRLADGRLPIPSVLWTAGDLELEITALASVDSTPARAVLYRVENRGAAATTGSLFVAVRPFQVNPPAQFLNVQGGSSPVRSIAWDGRRVVVNGERALRPQPAPAAFGAVGFDGGDVVADFLRQGLLPPTAGARDDFAAASGALRFDWALGPGDSRTFALDVEPARPPTARRGRGARTAAAVVTPHAAQAGWAAMLDRVAIDVPDTLVAQTLAAQIGYVLVNRDGAAIRPGTRSYRRSWIRDGALTSSALLRTGHAGAARAFLDWFAPHQYANGKIPCVVDGRGADPTPEHDSSGEFVFLVAECLRFDGDLQSTRGLWPRVQAAVAYLDSLRNLRRTPEFRSTEFFGLLPPSISHEGYSAKPMHSYWDDLWALRGFADAAYLAGALGLEAERDRMATLRADFARDLRTSVEATMLRHGIDYVPGCADLGDFDATSTTIALSPVQAGDALPPAAVERTFEKYWEFFAARRDGADWDGFTPYEIRNVGAFVRLGWRDRAHELLTWFVAQQRPQGWRQWPEVVYRDARAPRFLGDLPHTWVGSDFVRSVLDMLAYEDEATGALVLAHGVPAAWLEGGGVSVRALPTAFGPLSYTARRQEDSVVMDIEPGLRIPPGGIVVRMPPAIGPGAIVETPQETDPRLRAPQSTSTADGAVLVRALPARLIWM
jgi:hypothetical protein